MMLNLARQLQSLDYYTYNIRSWLTGINDINNCTTQAGDNVADAFSMRMTYQTADYTETPQYNGNIASLSWRAPLGTCRDIQGYNFSYDGVNRLRGATFWERSSGAPTITDKYSEPLLNYNLNGNITSYPLVQCSSNLNQKYRATAGTGLTTCTIIRTLQTCITKRK